MGEAETFDQTTVWQAIDGAAEVYLDYGFVSLTQQTYTEGGVQAEVQIYDVGSQLNAFGVYWRQRPDDAWPLASGGIQSLVEKIQCLAYRGTRYLRATAMDGAFTPASCRSLLSGLFNTIPEPSGPIIELALLPVADQVVHFLRYDPRSFVALRELKRCLWARYRDKKGKEIRMFVVVSDAESVWKAVEASSAWSDAPGPGAQTRVRKVPYQGPVAISRVGRRVAGVVGLDDPAQAAQKARKLAAGELK